jgi:hypothetical protein|tara:strand:- start:375 stop:674 length:300 start_codon:yes stop_codon:yes gene_type:complete
MAEKLEKTKIELPCPKGCSSKIQITYYDICSRKEAKCSRCGSKYKFGSSEASNLRSAMNYVDRITNDIESKSKELERKIKDFQKANERLLKSPDIELKN